jgi:hypothetical protein
MAGVGDVEAALRDACAVAVYPSGPASPSVTGALVRVERGWPQAVNLDKDLAQGIAHVSVVVASGMTRDTTRFPNTWQLVNQPTPTLTASVSGATVTFGGAGGAGQVAGLAIGAGITLAAYAYRLAATDTPANVAAAFAASIPGATSTASIVTLAACPVAANVVADAAVAKCVAQQEQGFRVTIWAPSPNARNLLDAAISSAVAGTRSFTFPDGTASGKPKLRQINTDDAPEKEQLWRRDYTFTVEYPTILTAQQPIVLFPGVVLNANAGVNGYVGSLVEIGAFQPQTGVLSDGSGNYYLDATGNLVSVQ